MGMPKKKWTSEEETALEAGIAKYGPGKWSTILKDREFAPILHLRSNIDLKDKWRNMNQFVSQPIRKPKNISAAPKEKLDKESSIQDPPTTLAPSLQKCSSKRPIPRLDNLILEAMSNGKPPHDSKRDKITEYIEVVTTTPADGLPSGWIKEIITKQYSTHKRSDPYYTDPLSGYIFRSKLDALRYLETGDVEKCAIKPKKKDISGEETDKIEKKPVDQESEVVPPPRTTKTQEDEIESPPTETQKAKIVPQTKTKIMPRLTKCLESNVVPPSTKSNQPKLVRRRKRLKQMVVVRRKMSERIILNKLKRPAFGEGGPGTSIDKAVNLD